MRINNIQFLANMANVLSMLFIPVFARTLGASYLEIGVITGFFSAAPFFPLSFSGGSPPCTACARSCSWVLPSLPYPFWYESAFKYFHLFVPVT